MTCEGSRYVGGPQRFAPCTEPAVTTRREERWGTGGELHGKLRKVTKTLNFCRECARNHDDAEAERAFEARWS